MTTEICYTNLNARFKNQFMVVTYRDVEDFIKQTITELILIFPHTMVQSQTENSRALLRVIT